MTDDRPFFADMVLGTHESFRRFLVWGFAALIVLLALTCISRLLTGPQAGPILQGTSRPDEEDHSPESESELPADRTQPAAPASIQVRPLGWVAVSALYFAGIGLGFMLIEVCLAQKLIFYLGYPTLSLSVILFALLLGAGSGSLASQRLAPQNLAGWAAGAAVIVALLGWGARWWVDGLFGSTLQWPILARTITAAVAMLPLGFAMGVLFPSGVRRLRGADAGLVPWMWALNGTASVLGSVGAMCAAKLWGFHTVLALGGGCYGLVALLSVAEHLGLRNATRSGHADDAVDELRSTD